MSATDVVLAGRAAAEAIMLDTCLIEHKTGQSILDEDTGEYVTEWATLYAGKCRVQDSDLSGRSAESGEHATELQSRTLQVPMSVTGVQVDDRATITASALDPDLTGREFRVRDLAHKTHMTSRRLPIEEVTG